MPGLAESTFSLGETCNKRNKQGKLQCGNFHENMNRPTPPLPLPLLSHSGTMQSSNWMGQTGLSQEGRRVRQGCLSSEPVQGKDTCSARETQRGKGTEGSGSQVSHCWKGSFNLKNGKIRIVLPVWLDQTGKFILANICVEKYRNKHICRDTDTL